METQSFTTMMTTFIKNKKNKKRKKGKERESEL